MKKKHAYDNFFFFFKENDVERKCGRYHPVPMVEFDEEKRLKE